MNWGGQCELVTYMPFVMHVLKALLLHYSMISNSKLAHINTDFYIKNFMVTTNQKPVIDAHTKTIKEYKQSSKDDDQIMRERTKERNKKDYKTMP